MYITIDDVIAAYGIDQVNIAGSPKGSGRGAIYDQVIVDRAIADACSLIDAHLDTRYTLPLQITPPLLKKLAVDIALYNMALDVTKRTTEMGERFANAMEMLDRIAKGRAGLGLSRAQLEQNGDTDAVRQGLGRSVNAYRA